MRGIEPMGGEAGPIEIRTGKTPQHHAVTSCRKPFKDAGGKVTTWSLEGYPPNTLKRTGFSRDVLKIGDEVTATFYKSKDGTNTGAGREITFSDGSKKFAGPAGAY